MGTRSGLPDGTIQHSHQYSVVGKDGTVYSSFELKTIATNPGNMPKAMILRSDKNSLNETQKSLAGNREESLCLSESVAGRGGLFHPLFGIR